MPRPNVDRSAIAESLSIGLQSTDSSSSASEITPTDPVKSNESTVTYQKGKTIDVVGGGGYHAISDESGKETPVDDKNDAKKEEPKAEKSTEPKKQKDEELGEFDYKADGTIQRVKDLADLKKRASYSTHVENKLTEINQLKRDLELQHIQWKNMVNDPQAFINYMQSQGIDVTQYLKPNQRNDDEIPELEELKINDDFDTDSEKNLKRISAQMHKQIIQQGKMLEKFMSKAEANDWMIEYAQKSKQYDVPQNAANAIAALMQTGQMKFGDRYTMDAAMKDYVNSLPNYQLTADAVKANPILFDQLKSDILAEYNAELDRQKSENKVPKIQGKMPSLVSDDDENKQTGYQSFRSLMGNKFEKLKIKKGA